MSIRSLAHQHIGRPVVVRSRYGVHRGILHHVDDNGMYLRLANGNQLTSAAQQATVQTLGEAGGELDAEHVFWPLFFIPWAFALALSPWYYGPYWW
ncbi:hypothetical protein [Alicyclobacillus fodiniaquatilis]|uniref:Uncharacterized protein n=1 Tax=Alicyclobacillus fodiniaquatilis TaxID=1661150 RepID=A0ABW4JPB5_9BACL